jgi:hypothetical protein
LAAENNLRDLETMYNQDLTDDRVTIAELESLVGADLGKGVPSSKSSHHDTK